MFKLDWNILTKHIFSTTISEMHEEWLLKTTITLENRSHNIACICNMLIQISKQTLWKWLRVCVKSKFTSKTTQKNRHKPYQTEMQHFIIKHGHILVFKGRLATKSYLNRPGHLLGGEKQQPFDQVESFPISYSCKGKIKGFVRAIKLFSCFQRRLLTQFMALLERVTPSCRDTQTNICHLLHS